MQDRQGAVNNLRMEFPDFPPDGIERLYNETFRELEENATLKTFLPLLAESETRKRLRKKREV